MNKIFFIPFFLFFSFLSAQNPGLALEKNAMEAYKANPENYDFIEVLSVIDSAVTREGIDRYKFRIDKIIETFPPKEDKDRREGKRIKKIYDMVHESFFVKYEDLAYFPDIFGSGKYNCVTATALYAHIFDRLEIPYIIQEAPSHVYMIAYPHSLKIHLETTVPGNYGFHKPKDSDIEKVVKEMVQMKLVTQEEVNEKSVQKIYQDYFFGEEKLDKNVLVGMQYYNKALELNRLERNREAYDAIQKSLFFYSYPPARMLNKFLISVNLEERKYNTKEDVIFLVDTFRDLKYGDDFQENDLKHYLSRIVHHDDNSNKFLELSASIFSKFEEERVASFSKEFLFEYLARKNADKEDLDEAIRTSDSVFKYNVKSKIAQEIIAYAVPKKLSLLSVSENSLQSLFEFNSRYDFLSGDRRFETLKAFYYGQLAMGKYQERKEKEGREYLELFGNSLNINGDLIQIPPAATSEMYLKAGRYYYGKSRFKDALKIFEQGLAFDPSNSELKKMVQWAGEDLKK